MKARNILLFLIVSVIFSLNTVLAENNLYYFSAGPETGLTYFSSLTSDGQYLYAVGSYSPDNVNYNGFIMKFDKELNNVSAYVYSYNTENSGIVFNSICSDGQYLYVSGQYYPNGGTSIIMKINKNLQPVEIKRFDSITVTSLSCQNPNYIYAVTSEGVLMKLDKSLRPLDSTRQKFNWEAFDWSFYLDFQTLYYVNDSYGEYLYVGGMAPSDILTQGIALPPYDDFMIIREDPNSLTPLNLVDITSIGTLGPDTLGFHSLFVDNDSIYVIGSSQYNNLGPEYPVIFKLNKYSMCPEKSKIFSDFPNSAYVPSSLTSDGQYLYAIINNFTLGSCTSFVIKMDKNLTLVDTYAISHPTLHQMLIDGDYIYLCGKSYPFKCGNHDHSIIIKTPKNFMNYTDGNIVVEKGNLLNLENANYRCASVRYRLSTESYFPQYTDIQMDITTPDLSCSALYPELIKKCQYCNPFDDKLNYSSRGLCLLLNTILCNPPIFLFFLILFIIGDIIYVIKKRI